MNVIDPIHVTANARPDDTALIFPKGRISWGRLDRLLWSTAQRFHDEGLVAGDRVGLTMQHPILHLLCSLGLARIGAAQVSLPPSDSERVRREISGKLGLKSIIVDSGKFTDPGLPSIVFDKAVDSTAEVDKQSIACDDGTATWLFLQSSGTTGKPKFAELSHESALERSTRFLPLFNCDKNDVFWAVSRVDFVVAKQRLLYALHAGAALCVPVGIPIQPDILPFLRSAGVTLACGTPSHLHQLLGLQEANPIPTLRAFEARSATISERLRAEFKDRICPNLHIVYGTNEGEALAMASPELQAKVPNTVGRATDSIDLEVVDSSGNTLAPGVTGEVRVRGPGVMTAYFENAEATQKSFRDGWFYPGDLGWLSPERALVLQGRKDDMMIFDGMNIYPAEIENALMDHPAVKDVAAYAMKHERFQDVPAAAVIVRYPVSEQELIQHCLDRIGIKHPRKIRFLRDFPRNSMGKILKRELATFQET